MERARLNWLKYALPLAVLLSLQWGLEPAEAEVLEPYNANENSSCVKLVIVVDNGVYRSMDSDLEKVHHYCKDVANFMNAVSLFASIRPHLSV